MNIGIVGSRRRNTEADKELIRYALKKLIEKGVVIDRIVSGGCPLGADRFAEELNVEFNFPPPLIFYPDKSKLDPKKMKINPKWAYSEINYARNTLVAENSHVLIALVAPDRKGGTEDTIKKFIAFRGRGFLIIIE